MSVLKPSESAWTKVMALAEEPPAPPSKTKAGPDGPAGLDGAHHHHQGRPVALTVAVLPRTFAASLANV